MTDLPTLDPRSLRELVDLGVGPEVIQELVGLYRQDVPLRMAGLETALAQAQAEDARNEAHQMKGALGNLGLLRMAELARLIEVAAREGRWEEARRVAAVLPAAYDEGLAALREAFPEA